jgi:transcriptional regulator with XRE-family HTH domain
VCPRSFHPDPSLLTLGEAVKTLRRERGLTQEQLAERAGTHVTYVGRIERGERNLTWTALRMICKGLQVKLSTLVTLVEELEGRR